MYREAIEERSSFAIDFAPPKSVLISDLRALQRASAARSGFSDSATMDSVPAQIFGAGTATPARGRSSPGRPSVRLIASPFDLLPPGRPQRVELSPLPLRRWAQKVATNLPSSLPRRFHSPACPRYCRLGRGPVV